MSVFGLPLDSSSGGLGVSLGDSRFAGTTPVPVGKQPKKRENLGQSHVDSFWQTVNGNGKTTFSIENIYILKKVHVPIVMVTGV